MWPPLGQQGGRCTDFGEGSPAQSRWQFLVSHTEAGALLTQIKAAYWAQQNQTSNLLLAYCQEGTMTHPCWCIWCEAGAGAMLKRCFSTRATVSCKTPVYLSSHWEMREPSLSGPFQSRCCIWFVGVCLKTPKDIPWPTEWFTPIPLSFPICKACGWAGFYYWLTATSGMKYHSCR